MSQIRPNNGSAGAFLISGELVFDTVPELLESGRAMFESGAGEIRLDFQGVTRADSAGLALLVEWLRAAGSHGQTIMFLNVPKQMIAMAKVSGLDVVLPLGES